MEEPPIPPNAMPNLWDRSVAARLRGLPPLALALGAIVLAGAAGALGLISISARSTYRELEAAAATRASAYELLAALRQTRQHIGEIRVGLTGYVLTHDTVYLATYNSGMSGWPKDTLALKRLATGEPTVERQVAGMIPTIITYATEMRREMDAAGRGRPTDGTRPQVSRSALLLESARQYFVAIESEQMRLMDNGARDVAAAVRRSRNLITGVLAFGIVVILGVGGSLLVFLLNREFRRQLRTDQERQRAFFAASPLPMLLYDRRTLRIAEVNDAAVACFGHSRKVFSELSVEDVLGESEIPRYRDKLAIAPAGLQHTGVWTHRRSDGTTFDADVTRTDVDLDGQPLRLAVVQDVTEQRRMDAQLRQSQKMEAVGRLAAGVAHDFNNIMATIGVSLDVLESAAGDNEAARADAEIMRQSVKHGARLSQQLLSFSRHTPLEPVNTGLNALLADTQGSIARTVGGSIALEIQQGEGVGEINVDPAQIQQVLLNLAANARDAMPNGGTLRIRTKREIVARPIESDEGIIPPGIYACISMDDSGFGMDETTRAHAFDPFFTTKPAGKGTGLGLSTVLGIVTQSGGFVRLHTTPGEGSGFDLYFPLAQAGAAQPAALPTVEDPLPPEAVQVVDDDEEFRRLIARELRNQGMHVLESADGDEALRVAAAYGGRLRLLVTDVVMPGMSGVALAHSLATTRPGLKVLFISGFSDERATEQGKTFRGATFLRKPFDSRSLHSSIRTLLAQD